LLRQSNYQTALIDLQQDVNRSMKTPGAQLNSNRNPEGK
jgi:hypothetical protein